MDIHDWLTELGGVARRGSLLRLLERTELDAAMEAGQVIRLARGLYGLPDLDEQIRLAHQLGGVLSHTSAALHHGWAVKIVPPRPHITVSRGRRVPSEHGAQLHFAELTAKQIDGMATSQTVTLDQCLRRLPSDEALCVADSALREGFGEQNLAALADAARGPGSVQVRSVAGRASGLAANPFETTLRSICDTVPGLRVRPQLTISEGGFVARPDLVDERLRLVLEADSFEWHGKRDALASDTRRYNAMVVRGWLVLRFCYEDVMFHPEEVRETLVMVVALAELLAEVLNKRGAGPIRAA